MSLNSPENILARLADNLEKRMANCEAEIDSSYTAKLFAKGPNTFLKKIGEEAAELIMACKDQSKDDVIYEAADLWFHSLVALTYYDIRPEQVLNELARREGVSGITEKNNRKS